jgi:hypothetical protein
MYRDGGKKRWPGPQNQTKSGKYLTINTTLLGGVKRHVIG